MALSSLPSPSQRSLSLGISVAAPAIIIPCLLLIADTAGYQQDVPPPLFSSLSTHTAYILGLNLNTAMTKQTFDLSSLSTNSPVILFALWTKTDICV